jgi:hypothetical protein
MNNELTQFTLGICQEDLTIYLANLRPSLLVRGLATEGCSLVLRFCRGSGVDTDNESMV